MGYIKNLIRRKRSLHATHARSMAVIGRSRPRSIRPEEFGPPVIPPARGEFSASECVYFTHDLTHSQKPIPNHQHRRPNHGTPEGVFKIPCFTSCAQPVFTRGHGRGVQRKPRPSIHPAGTAHARFWHRSGRAEEVQPTAARESTQYHAQPPHLSIVLVRRIWNRVAWAGATGLARFRLQEPSARWYI